MSFLSNMMGAATDLGLGSALSQQVKDQTEEERKRRQMLGIGPMQQQQGTAAQMLLGGGFGMTGVGRV